MKRQIITTKDGSHTVEIPELQITYHSHHGAVQESMHVFIEAGLKYWLQNQKEGCPEKLFIFEMGFGTGLNAYLTALEAEKQRVHIHYTAVEQYPLTPLEAAPLNYATGEEHKNLFSLLHQCPWQREVQLTAFFVLSKQQTSLLDFKPSHPADLIYFDAFAPAAQPELWTEAVFQKLHEMLRPGGVLVTYCSKGVVRRAMQAAGFTVTKIPGPPGKREMVRAARNR